MNNINYTVLKLLVLFFWIFYFSLVVHGQLARELKPIGATEYRVVENNTGGNGGIRRRLAPYQLCLLCRCCAGGNAAAATCITMPCCFGIDCQLPNKPFGVCAFVPKACNCTSCPTQKSTS